MKKKLHKSICMVKGKLMKKIDRRMIVLIVTLSTFMGIIFACKCFRMHNEKILVLEDDYFDIGYVKSIKNNEVIYDYYYDIYNTNKKCVRRRKNIQHEPRIHYIDETIIEIFISAGSDTYYCTYYDAYGDNFSEQYEGRIAAKYRKIAYLMHNNGDVALIVRDIFDKNIFYKSYSLDFASMVQPVIEAEFVNENTLYISYFSEIENELKTQILDLTVDDQ